MPTSAQVDITTGTTATSDGISLPDDDGDLMEHTYEMLKALRRPFDITQVEHLPRQKWKGAWQDQPSQTCDECGGYHPSARYTIHLDYIGHAGVTDRLLEVDPLWEWEPLATDESGLPLFDKLGGLWIKLTVCGVTRLGYGDAAGKSASTTAVKEIIGDAIRNAAMRFGVALDLWSKSDLHSQKNPGAIDDDTPRQTPGRKRQGGDRAHSGERDGVPMASEREPGQQRGTAGDNDPPRAANQDALDELMGICDKHGLDPREVESRYNRDFGPPKLVTASPDDIRNYGAILISEANPEPDGEGAGGEQPAAAAAAAADPLDGTKPPDDDAPLF